jgi:hypothetical protein
LFEIGYRDKICCINLFVAFGGAYLKVTWFFLRRLLVIELLLVGVLLVLLGVVYYSDGEPIVDALLVDNESKRALGNLHA